MASESLLTDLIAQQREIERSAFEVPLPSFEAYCTAVGKWQGLQCAIDIYLNRKDAPDPDY